MSLLITKQAGNFFSLVVDGGEPIISEQNRLTTIGNYCNFKTANGANLILKQNILYSDITIVDVSPVVPTSVINLWTNLISIGFFEGVSVSVGGGVLNFKDLLDTFNYLGRAGQIVAVNNSETGLTTISYSVFTAADRIKLDGIQAGAQVNIIPNWAQTNPLAPDYISGKPNPSSSSIQRIDGFIGITVGFDVGQQNFALPSGAICMDVWLSHQRQYQQSLVNVSLLNLWSQTDNVVTLKKSPVLNNYLEITYQIPI